jgi:DNA-binding NtrC family response regulator
VNEETRLPDLQITLDGNGQVSTSDDAQPRAPAVVSAGRQSPAKLRSLVSKAVEAVERHFIAAALKAAHGNRTATARLLGLSRQSLYIKLARYGLDSPEDLPFDGVKGEQAP